MILFSAPKPAAEVRQLLLAHQESSLSAGPAGVRKRQPVARTA